MMSILNAVLVMALLGVVFSLVLGLAAKVFYVYVDPRIESIADMLPGANCGGCGFASCSSYAEAIINEGVSPTRCVAGGEDVTQNVCSLLGISAEAGSRNVAQIFCRGSRNKALHLFDYAGAEDCIAAHVVTGGDKACKYGCLGLGTCVRKCPFGALSIGNDGLPHVDIDLCTGCGNCVAVCPRGIPRLVATSQNVANLCVSKDAGKTVKQVCQGGCIACAVCTKQCPEKAIRMQEKLAEVDPDKCTGDYVCVEKCPTGSMQKLFTAEEEEGTAVEVASPTAEASQTSEETEQDTV
ncbi:MAG: Fe-S cluster domain-containing protein [Desulfohalobiaceae bacterium]|nr:Fe-S cluster domain-containing protein [Desulfohalobiaceae bacterium]